MLIALDRKAFEHALTRWAEALLSRPIAAAASLPEAYALDGKSARELRRPPESRAPALATGT